MKLFSSGTAHSLSNGRTATLANRILKPGHSTESPSEFFKKLDHAAKKWNIGVDRFSFEVEVCSLAD